MICKECGEDNGFIAYRGKRCKGCNKYLDDELRESENVRLER